MNEEQATRIATNAIDYQAAQIAKRDTRIKQLERQCAVLAAEIDRMRPVVEAAIESAKGGNDYKGIARIRRVVKIYEAAREQGNGISTR